MGSWTGVAVQIPGVVVSGITVADGDADCTVGTRVADGEATTVITATSVGTGVNGSAVGGRLTEGDGVIDVGVTSVGVMVNGITEVVGDSVTCALTLFEMIGINSSNHMPVVTIILLNLPSVKIEVLLIVQSINADII